VCWKRPVSFSKDASRTTSSKTESFWIHFSTLKPDRNLAWSWPLNGASLSRAMGVHHAHFTVHFLVALRFTKDGVRVRLRRLFCVCAARKQRPDRDENYKSSRHHVFHLNLSDTQVNLEPGVPTAARNESGQLPPFNCAMAAKWLHGG
jgi:hypothetical protein